MELPEIAHKAAAFYQDFSGLSKDLCRSLKTLWWRDLEHERKEEAWKKIVAVMGKYNREARGQFIHIQANTFYFTPAHSVGCVCGLFHANTHAFIDQYQFNHPKMRLL